MSALELVCPAGTPAALKTAVEAGADAVYLGFRDETNARNFPGLNFDREELAAGIAIAHRGGAKVFLAVNTYPLAGSPEAWYKAIADAARLGVDAVIVADLGLAAYAQRKYPRLRLHLSVQAAASTPEALDFYAREFGFKRAVLPRVLSIPEIAALTRAVSIETEVFVFGGLCVMAEGRCQLSSYATGKSPNMNGVCSPASDVAYVRGRGQMTATLGGYVIDRFADGEPAGYPTLCKGRFMVDERASYVFEEPTSLNALGLLPELKAAGVKALKIEGRQRSKAYVAQVVSAFRRAIDALDAGKAIDGTALAGMLEGGRETGGAYRKTWR